MASLSFVAGTYLLYSGHSFRTAGGTGTGRPFPPLAAGNHVEVGVRTYVVHIHLDDFSNPQPHAQHNEENGVISR